jgi:hypothetical protein
MTVQVSNAVPERRELDIGRVLGQSFSLLGNKLPRYFLLSALPGLPALLAAIFSNQINRFQSSSNPFAGLIPISPGGGIAAAIFIVLMVLAVIVVFVVVFTAIYVAMIYGVFQDLRGQEFRLGDGLGRGLSRFWPLVGLSICAGLGMIFGFILLIVPGLILLTMWWVAVPACVLDRTGPIRSLERSGDLTRGNRWRIFAVILVIGIVSKVVGAILSVPILLGLPIVAAVLSYIWSTLTTAYHLIATVVAYYELRVAREGIDANSIASVFD